ncbi:MAG: amidase [Pseudomonadota bacterium]
MKSSKLNELTALHCLNLIKAGECSAQDIALACLKQIETYDKTIQAWVHVDHELVLEEAIRVDGRIARGQCGDLAGIPVGVKDIFNTHNMPTQMGSPIWKDFRPGNDARVVHNLRMADSIILGKTVTAEFAVHTPGPTLNPHNSEYMAGTSSTGSAVAVACCMVPLALGTQTAGSIIRPASYNGVYGFKPSFGLIPRTAMLKTTDSLDTVGFFTRSVDDLHILLDVLRVHGSNYPIQEAALDESKRKSQAKRPWKVAIIKGPKWECSEPYAQKAYIDFSKRLSLHRNVEVFEKELPECLKRAHNVHSTIYDRTLAYYFRQEFKKQTLVSSIMYEIIERGNSISLEEYKAALEDQYKIASAMDIFFTENCDIMLDLSTGGEALRGINSVDRPDNCLIWTLGGLPVVNVPVFVGPNGLPFGIQVIGRRYNDYGLLSFLNYLKNAGILGSSIFPVRSVSN